VVVTSEYRYSVEGSRIRSLARCDIWITLQARKKAALIVIENKIAAREGAGQLGWYEREARKWCKKHKGRSLLVWLAPEKRNASDGWANLSYLELASALRKAWRRNLRAVGRPWLGLYIAAITSGVLGIDINRRQFHELATDTAFAAVGQKRCAAAVTQRGQSGGRLRIQKPGGSRWDDRERCSLIWFARSYSR
jgi:hypothetical protein